MKRGNLSQTEIKYIEENASKGKDQIALDLDRSVKQVEKHYVEPVKSTAKALTPAQKRAQSTFGKKVKNGKVLATVATTASATLGDDMKKGKKLEAHIHKPYGNQ